MRKKFHSGRENLSTFKYLLLGILKSQELCADFESVRISLTNFSQKKRKKIRDNQIFALKSGYFVINVLLTFYKRSFTCLKSAQNSLLKKILYVISFKKTTFFF